MFAAPPHVVDVPARQVAVIRLTVPRAALRTVMGPAIAEVMAVVAAQGAGPAGALFSHHLRMDPDVFDLEVGVPVATPVVAAGRVVAGVLPGARVARAVSVGGYAQLPADWGALRDWIGAHRFASAPNCWEMYAEGPAQHADPAAWRTELYQPLTA